MEPKKKGSGSSLVLLVTTSRPSVLSCTTSAGSSTNGGGSLTLLCPKTGSVLSSTRIHAGDLLHNATSSFTSQQASASAQVGIDTLSCFTLCDKQLAIGYGSSTSSSKKKDAYGTLFTIRQDNHQVGGAPPPILHWKCRLPEPLTAGLLVSPVTRHIVGGGTSGNLYVWSGQQQGNRLLRTIKAHYRSITSLQWSTTAEASTGSSSSPWNSHLITGGADGMVHVFSLIDLVEVSSSSLSNNKNKNSTSTSVQPIRTWTKHHLAVTALISLPGGRIVSGAQDGQVVVMELCSAATLAVFQMPDTVASLTFHNNRLFVGSVKGIVYIIDLDEYAINQTKQLGATVVRVPNQQQRGVLSSIEDQVFGGATSATGKLAEDESLSVAAAPFQIELRGHDRAVTSLACFNDDDNTEWLVSGDEAGIIRLWDCSLQRACCVRVIHPWSSSATASSSTTTISKGTLTHQLHPVTSIHVLREDQSLFGFSKGSSGASTMFGNDGGAAAKKNYRANSASSPASMIAPLQKYASVAETESAVSVPSIEPYRDEISSQFWNLSSGSFSLDRARKLQSHVPPQLAANTSSNGKKRKLEPGSNAAEELTVAQDEIERLKQELEEAKSTIVRWETVNNKILAKLQQDHNE